MQLPDLSKHQEVIQKLEGSAIAFLEHHISLMALLGLVVFYGLERVVKASRQRRRQAGERDAPSANVFWLHITSFAIYNT